MGWVRSNLCAKLACSAVVHDPSLPIVALVELQLRHEVMLCWNVCYV